MVKVNLEVTTRHNNDGEDSSEPYSYRGTTSGTVERVYISTDDYHYGYRGMETDLEPPFYVVYGSYYTGDTFGSDFDACVIGVEKLSAEAEALAKEASEFKGYGQLSNGFYVPWNGYFESLISVNWELVGV